MPWHYRIFRTRYQHLDGCCEDHFTVREVYYDGAGQILGITDTGSTPGGATRTALRKDHALMQAAFRRPVLTPGDIPGYAYAEREVPLDETEAGEKPHEEETDHDEIPER